MFLVTVTFVFFILLIFSMTGIIVYFAIRSARRENRQYEKFAKEYSYYFDKAQGQLNYHEASKKSQTGLVVNLKESTNPFVEKYANFSNYPFGRGAKTKVAYAISGNYEDVEFRAFTYMFAGSLAENSGKGGVFSIVMIKCDRQPQILPEQTFFENGTLCHYLQGNLEVEKIHDRIEKLRNLKND